MHRYLLFLLFILAACSNKSEQIAIGSHSHPNKLASVSIIDRNGMSETVTSKDRLDAYQGIDWLKNQPFQKVLRIYQRGNDGKVYAYVTSYYPNGQAHQYLEIVDGRASGTYKEWYPSGQLKVFCNVVGGQADLTPSAQKSWVFDGLSEAWNEEGDLTAKIPYEKGMLQGEALYYHHNGKIWKEIPYYKDKIQGTVKIYEDNGNLLSTQEYKNDAKEGLGVRYWAHNIPAAKEQYKMGFLKEGEYYEKDGTPISKIEDGTGYRAIFSKNGLYQLQQYTHGVLQGIIKEYDDKGNVIHTFMIENGVKNGPEVEYFPQIKAKTPFSSDSVLQPKLYVDWKQGVITGSVKTWYENGNLRSVSLYSQNKKNGVSSAWYKDGSLMMTEDYEQNKLNKGQYFKRGDKQPISSITNGNGTATLYDESGSFLKKVQYRDGEPVEE